MAFSVPCVPLSPFWQKERLLLVRAVDAIRLCSEGTHEQLAAQQSLPHLLGAARARSAEVRDFVAKARLLSLALADCDDDKLFAYLCKLVEARTLAVVRESDASTAEPSLVKQRRAIRALAQSMPSGLKLEGRTYRLVADGDLGRMHDRDDYTVVSQAEAMRVLDGLATLAPPTAASQLRDARNQLARDWRLPMAPDGIVLLKKIVVPQSVPKSEAPLGKAGRGSGGQAAAEGPAEEDAHRPCAALRQAQQAEALNQAAEDGEPFCADCGPPAAG